MPEGKRLGSCKTELKSQDFFHHNVVPRGLFQFWAIKQLHFYIKIFNYLIFDYLFVFPFYKETLDKEVLLFIYHLLFIMVLQIE
jgi:hypothetical protein